MPLYSQEQINTIAAKIKRVRFGMLTTSDHEQMLSSRPLTVQQIDGEGNMWFFGRGGLYQPPGATSTGEC